MSRLYEEIERMADSIRFYQNEMEKEKALFEKCTPAIKAIDERVYKLFESGYKESRSWSQHSIDMAKYQVEMSIFPSFIVKWLIALKELGKLLTHVRLTRKSCISINNKERDNG